ncbi:prepilin-type N-terminal cleavage/methylation domain-containing protein [Edaphobacillus lindanitolerans]|uniref:Type IV pilus assembly protein PilA n=1 Tax=Edaphobacillus lindanitolerans TaxID=550447 RepID=A0A1U7PQA9_9BACI|nr:prepilin-type N-terminal cleavage/methylation domain-containing protein [Edaphobacillus lindanitolerans]SIT83212.1 type IV pilus assembly protein PilA [Edaphobacillus lindanitolerans]
MRKFVKSKLKEEKGLTLIELLAVIVILGIIAAIAIPAIGNIIENSKYNAVKSDALNALSAANLVEADDPKALEATDGVTIKKLVDDGYLDNAGKLADSMTVKKVNKSLVINGTTTAYSGSKTVTFNNATVKIINDDNQKGSAANNKTIPKAAS